jgi:hypothetical protein
LYEKWPDEPAEGRAVYLNEADKQPPKRPSVIRRKVPVLLTRRSGKNILNRPNL